MMGLDQEKKKECWTYIRRDDLLVPSLTRELPVAKQTPSDLAIRAITADDILRLQSLLTLGRLDHDPGLVRVLAERLDLVAPGHRRGGLARDVLGEDLSQPVQRQTYHAVRVIPQHGHVQAREVRPVEFAPAHRVRQETLGAQVLDYPSAAQLIHGGRPIVCRSRLLVEFLGLVDQLHLDAVLRKHEA